MSSIGEEWGVAPGMMFDVAVPFGESFCRALDGRRFFLPPPICTTFFENFTYRGWLAGDNYAGRTRVCSIYFL